MTAVSPTPVFCPRDPPGRIAGCVVPGMGTGPPAPTLTLGAHSHLSCGYSQARGTWAFLVGTPVHSPQPSDQEGPRPGNPHLLGWIPGPQAWQVPVCLVGSRCPGPGRFLSTWVDPGSGTSSSTLVDPGPSRYPSARAAWSPSGTSPAPSSCELTGSRVFLFLNACFTAGAPFVGYACGFLDRSSLLTLVPPRDPLAHGSCHVYMGQPLVSPRKTVWCRIKASLAWGPESPAWIPQGLGRFSLVLSD